MTRINELRSHIRDFIHHARRRTPLVADTPNWNQLASAFDTIADNELAIEAYELAGEPSDSGSLYILTYGILQTLYVQQDAVESLVRGFHKGKLPPYKIENEPEAEKIRSVRNKAVGHPTVHQKKGRLQTSHYIARYSMSKTGFQLITADSNGNTTFREISILELIQENRTMIERVLRKLKAELEEAEMAHREQFRNENLRDIFPATLDYHFEKVGEGIRNAGNGRREFGTISLDQIVSAVGKFRAALQSRGILTATSDYEYPLTEIEYPLGELTKFFAGKGTLTDRRAAEIFAYFAQKKAHHLQRIAQELDEEYQENL